MMRSLAVFFCILYSIKTVSAELGEEKDDPLPFSEITVTLKMEWNVTEVGKPIPASYTTNVKKGTVLVDIVNKAAGDDKEGPFNKYDSTFYGGMGYLITAMNGTEQDPATSTYWMIFDGQTGGLTPCGVSFYVPVDNSTTIFRFTQDSADSNATGYCKLTNSSGQVPPSPITVTIGLDWDITIVGKPVPSPYTTQVNAGTVLVDILNKAADEDPEGPYNKWASTYYGGLGHFITAMDGVEQDPQTKTYWMIYDNKTGTLTPLGVDEYQPKDDSVTVFRLESDASQESEAPTKSSGHDKIEL